MSSDHKLLEPIDCELVVELVGAVGTQFRDVFQRLDAQCRLTGYDVETVKV
jgi:hypothetical protein